MIMMRGAGYMKMIGCVLAYITTLMFCSIHAQKDYDVRLLGGTDVNTGQVQVFIEERWRSICTCNKPECWSIQEATTVCRSLGHESAFSLSGDVVTLGIQNETSPISVLNCKDDEDVVQGASDFVRFCQSLEIDEDGRCDADHTPKTVTCNPTQTNFTGRLEYVKGHSESYKMNKGYVRIKHGVHYYFVCDDGSWNQQAADVFCRSLGLEPSNGLPGVSPLTDWDPNELFGIMSQVSCSAEDEDLRDCDHQFGLQTCPYNQFATASCMGPVDTTMTAKPKEDDNTDQLDLSYAVFITGMVGLLFVLNLLIAIATLRKKCREQDSPACRQLAPSYSSVLRDDEIVRDAPPPPEYDVVVKHVSITLDPDEEPLAPSYSTVLREDQLARSGPPSGSELSRDESHLELDLTGDRDSLNDQSGVRPASDNDHSSATFSSASQIPRDGSSSEIDIVCDRTALEDQPYLSNRSSAEDQFSKELSPQPDRDLPCS